MTITRIGRYEVEKQLGAGAMAVVYKAVDPLIGRTVAIKTIKFDSSIGLEQEEMRQRLYREAQSAGNLGHPSIITIFDIGEEGNVAYIAMEFIEGESLQEWLARNSIPPVPQTVSIIQQIASGLDYAAARGIIHRDIKPANILLTADMRAKIADFGIAKFSTSKFTQTGAVMGTPAYMSPEQAMGATLDGRSDIFSLGVIFYEMLTGERPFTGTNSTTIIYKILHEEPVPPQRLNVALNPAFDHIVGRMLAKDPNQRYQNCKELIGDLENMASMGSKAGKTAKTTKAPTLAAPQAARAQGSHKIVLAAIVAVLVVVIGALGFLLYQQSQRPASTPAAPAATPVPAPIRAQSAPQTMTPPASKKTATPAPPTEAPKEVPVAEKPARVPAPKPAPVVEKPHLAGVRLEFSGASYPITVYDGARRLEELSSSMPSVQILAGEHRFRVVSEEVFLDQQLKTIRLKADEEYPISLPGLCSVYIEVPNDAYDGCEIQVNGRRLPTPYPAQISRLAAGDHRVIFRWNSGKYAGKEFASTFSGQANHHYRVRGEPQTQQIVVQQIR
jgi:tRNA A-37 threonylcarbamoyl transferase component Bud32